MYFTDVFPLISSIFVFILGLVVFLKNKKSRINFTFFLHSLSIVIWLFCTFMMFISRDNKEMVIFWDRFVYTGVVFIPVFMYHFGLAFTNKKRDFLLYIGYALSIIFLFLTRTKFFVDDVFVYKWGIHTKAQLFHHIFLIYFVSYVIIWFFQTFKYYKNLKSGILRQQAKYIFIGFLFLFTIGPLAYLPAYGVGIYPFSYISGLIFTIILAYAILKYRLMDIKLVVKRSTIFSLIVIAITAAYAMSAFLVGLVVFGGVYTLQTQIITGLIVALLVAFGFKPLYEWLKKTTDTFLFKGEYSPQELMAEITDVVSRTLDLDVVIETLEDKITSALRIKKIEIVTIKEDSFSIVDDSLISLKKKKRLQKLTEYFKKQKDVLVLEEIKRKDVEESSSAKNKSLIICLERLNTALAVPLFVKKKLVGIFLLRNKKSGDMFTNEDIKTLETIAAQAGIAIENARLYEEMRDFSKTLQKEVERQTKTLKDANVRLKQLDVAKSEFISLASHQLRTPLTIIKGYISMIMEGSWGKVTDKQKEQLKKVYSSNDRLIKLVEDLLTVSRIESGRLEFEYKLVSLEEMIEGVVKEFSQMAKNKELYLKFNKPTKALPKVKVDSLKIRQVIQNLIDNAIHYTKKGGITINLKAKKDKVVFSIKDTGIGVSPEEKSVLFEKFSRGKEVGKINTEGTGLGLYLGAKMIQAHNGKIWVESEGRNKGSTFYFELPVKSKKK